MICPKCGYQRTNVDDKTTPTYQCPKCDVIYSKYIARQIYANAPSAPKLPIQQKTSLLLSKKVLIPLGIVTILGLVGAVLKLTEPQQKLTITKIHKKIQNEHVSTTRLHERNPSSPIFDLESLKQRCADNVACLGPDLVLARVPGCQQFIEKQARYRYKWTNGFLSSPFKLFLWVDNEHSVIRAIGDQLELENAFGAWQNHTYRCDMKISDGQVINIIVQPGRL